MVRATSVVVLLSILANTSTFAIDKDWNLSANGTWNSGINWSPNGVPSTTDDVYIGRNLFPQGFLTTLDTDATVGTLTLRNGSDFNTSDKQLIVNGLTTVAGIGTTFTIGPRATADFDGLDTQGLTIDNSGLVNMNGGILELESGALDILAGNISGNGGLGGFGTIELIQSGLAGAQVFNNSGRLFVGKSQFALGGTLTITNSDTNDPGLIGDGTVDLDGDSELGVVDVDDDPFGLSSNLTLVIDASLTDSFAGEMLIGRGDTVDFRKSWTLGGGTLQLNGSSGTATLMGSTMTVNSNATINVNSGTGAIASNFTLTSGTINVLANTTLRLEGTATINDAEALDISDTGTLHVTGNTTISEVGGDFDWDAGGNATTRVSGNGSLNINVDNVEVGGGDEFNGRLDLDDNGALVVNVADGEWVIGATADLNKNGSGLSSISGSRILVDGGVVVVNEGTLEVNPDIDFGFGSVFVVDPGATAIIDGTQDFLPGALVTINGTLELNGATVMNGPALISGSGTIINDGSMTVTANTTIGVATLDWDQGNTTVQAGKSLTLNVTNVDQGNDSYNTATTTVNSGSLTVNVADDEWNLGSGGVLLLVNTNGTEPVLGGDRVRLSNGGAIRVSGGDVDITAPVTIDTGSELLVQSVLTLQLMGATNLNGGNINESAASTVGQFGAVTVTGASSINVTTYNWDQAPTTIESGGSLTLNVGAIDVQAGERYDQVLTLNSGQLVVHNTLNAWTIDELLNLNNTSGTIPTISGEPVNIGDGVNVADARVRVGGTGVSRFDTDVTYNSDADVVVNLGATLRHNDTTTFQGGGSFTGSGKFDLASNVQINGTTTWNMPAGTVDFDGPDTDLTGNSVNIDGPVTVQAATVASFGKVNTTGLNALNVDSTAGGSLTVTLTNPADAWTVNAPGFLTLASGNAATTVLAGSDVVINGQLSIFGDVRTTARLDLAGNTSIFTVGEPLRMEGGSVANPNRLLGGSIGGAGILNTSTGHALYGFGTVSTEVDFDGNSQLKADNGELTVSGTVTDMGEIGTADVDGTLNMVNAWNTNVANNTRMAGGVLKGGTITNDAATGIKGFGSITARVTNSTLLAADGGTLVIDNPATDYDGSGNIGVLDATLGSLEIRDNTLELFRGTARVGAGRSTFINGFRFDFNSTSTLQMTGGSWRSTHGTNLAGTITVDGGAASTIDTDGDVIFATGSNTTLLGNLRVANSPTIVQVGANFSGGGDLINESGSSLRLNDGALMAVGVQNQGTMQIATATGRGDVSDFIQSSSGSLVIDLAGTSLPLFDRLISSGGAQLDGALNVSLSGGFVPALGNSFQILTATAGVSGTFATENLPLLGSGLKFDVVYNASNVLLQVIQSLSPDFDMDGDVDGIDVDSLVMEIVAASNGPAFDLTGDGIVNTSDLTEWLDQAGAINLASGNSYIPGDANLDGAVDGSDFGIWNSNKFTFNAKWTRGDFNANGAIDGSDFGIWNGNKFTSADGLSVVPEPSSSVFLTIGLVAMAFRSRNCR